jgi:hypothetical protein
VVVGDENELLLEEAALNELLRLLKLERLATLESRVGKNDAVPPVPMM